MHYALYIQACQSISKLAEQALAFKFGKPFLVFDSLLKIDASDQLVHVVVIIAGAVQLLEVDDVLVFKSANHFILFIHRFSH